MTRLKGFSLVLAAWLTACSSGGSGTRASSDAGGGFDPASLSRCIQTDLVCTGEAEYSACLAGVCKDRYTACFGAGYSHGDFSGGACETYAACLSTAADPCRSGCATPDTTCQTCLATIGGCATNGGCMPPVCVSPPDAGGSAASSGTGDAPGDSGGAGAGGASSGGTPAASGGAKSASGGAKAATGGTGGASVPVGTCSDLQKCCAAIADATTKEECTSSYNYYVGMDPLCAQALEQFKPSCM